MLENYRVAAQLVASRVISRKYFIRNAMECIELNKFSIKNGVFWDVTPCGSYKNRRFGGT
jgi:hypothetical protein